eukprot:3067323-Rhodomonas_salina.2
MRVRPHLIGERIDCSFIALVRGDQAAAGEEERSYGPHAEQAGPVDKVLVALGLCSKRWEGSGRIGEQRNGSVWQRRGWAARGQGSGRKGGQADLAAEKPELSQAEARTREEEQQQEASPDAPHDLD